MFGPRALNKTLDGLQFIACPAIDDCKGHSLPQTVADGGHAWPAALILSSLIRSQSSMAPAAGLLQRSSQQNRPSARGGGGSVSDGL